MIDLDFSVQEPLTTLHNISLLSENRLFLMKKLYLIFLKRLQHNVTQSICTHFWLIYLQWIIDFTRTPYELICSKSILSVVSMRSTRIYVRLMLFWGKTTFKKLSIGFLSRRTRIYHSFFGNRWVCVLW